MSEGLSGIVATAVKGQEDAMALVEKLFDVAQPSAVYGEPATIGDHTVITASEVKVGMGFGFGGGGAPGAEGSGGEDETEGGEAAAGLVAAVAVEASPGDGRWRPSALAPAVCGWIRW